MNLVMCIQTFKKGFYKYFAGETYNYSTNGPFIKLHGLGDFEVYTDSGRVSVFTKDEFDMYFSVIDKKKN